MFRNLFVLTILVCITGCSGPTFTNLGNGVGVPTESIDEYAQANGVSRGEAKKQMLAELNEQRKAEPRD